MITDHLTGWPIATAIPDKEATTVANAIYKDLILVHGCPEILLSDNGKMIPRFESWSRHQCNRMVLFDDLSDCSPDCSDRSDCEDYCTDHETQEVEDPKN